MSDAIISLIRTYVAVWVSAGGLWLADRGIDLPIDPATIVFTAVAVSAYYAVVRALEARWPGVGKLLGAAQAPSYGPGRARTVVLKVDHEAVADRVLKALGERRHDG